MFTKKVYLAGPMDNSAGHGLLWRDSLVKAYNELHEESPTLFQEIEFVYPPDLNAYKENKDTLQEVMDAVHDLLNPNWQCTPIMYPSRSPGGLTEIILDGDINGMKNADCILALLNSNTGYGTIGELSIAYERGIPYSVIITQGFVQSIPSTVWVASLLAGAEHIIYVPSSSERDDPDGAFDFTKFTISSVINELVEVIDE